MKRRNKVICGVLALVSVTQMSFYDKLNDNERTIINSNLGSSNNLVENNSNALSKIDLTKEKDKNNEDTEELKVDSKDIGSKSNETKVDVDNKELDNESNVAKIESNGKDENSVSESTNVKSESNINDKVPVNINNEDKLAQNITDTIEKVNDNKKEENLNANDNNIAEDTPTNKEEDEENYAMDINNDVTTSAEALMLINEPSKEIINLQKKIDEVKKKVNDDKEKGINYAEDRLSDLYLDAVKDNDNLNDLNRILSEADKLIKDKEKDTQKVNDYILKINNCYNSLRKIQIYNSFSGTKGEVWNDTNGVKIQAHGGQVQKINGKWWWYGEDKTKGYRSNGISAYSSDDLYNWTFEGYVMRDLNSREQLDNDPYFSELYKDYSREEKDNVYLCIDNSSSVIERPKVIYNEKTGKYVMWFHDDGPTKEAPNSNYAAAAAGVAVSDSPNGPFKFINRYRLNVCPEKDKKGEWFEKSAGFARDMNLFIDDDKSAYIVYSSEENRTMFISKLNEDYTYLSSSVDSAEIGKDFVRLFPGEQREAPALFKYNNKYYMINSGATGWAPNQARYWVSDSILGEWKDMGDPCIDDNKRNTFSTQSTNVTPVDKKTGKFIFMADRWNESDLGDSRYVWLPLEFDWNGKLSIKDYKKWDLSDLNNKYSIKVNSKLKDIYTDLNDLPKTLNVGVYEDNKLVNKEVKVTWDVSDLKPLTKTNIIGKLEDLEREISTDVILVPDNLKYFIDCGNTESDMYNLVKGKSKTLQNEVCDKKYETDSWGYTGTIGKDIDYKNNDSKDSFDAGWWAYKGKTIDYKMHLESGKYNLISGFYEWWNTSRDMNITLSYINDYGRRVTETLGEFTNRDQNTLEYEFYIPKDEDVTISIASKNYNPPDPILSWLAVQSLDVKSKEEEDTEKNNSKDLDANKKEDNSNSSNIESSNGIENNQSSSNNINNNSASQSNSENTKEVTISSSSGSSSHKSSSSEDSNNTSLGVSSSSVAIENKKVISNSNNGWNKSNDGKLKYYENGKAITGWKCIDKKYYYFNEKGIMLNGWQKLNGKWYYLNEDGVMANGWKLLNDKWYYLGRDGDMKTEWQKINDKWYYLNEDGDMANGWMFLNDKWYYLGSGGDMQTGWQQINYKWYYFYEDGSMASNTSVNGYKLNLNGEMVE